MTMQVPEIWTPRARRRPHVECAPFGLGLPFNKHPRFDGGAAWTPATPSGLVLWLRADLGVTIGTGVSAWADQSSTGASFTQGTGAQQPTVNNSSINGQKGLTFVHANSSSLSAVHNAAWNLGAFTMIVVFKPTTLLAYAVLLTKSSGSGWSDGWGAYMEGTSTGVTGWSGSYSNGAATGAISNTTPYVARFEFSGSTMSSWLNGAAGGTHSCAEVDNISTVGIGNYAGGVFYDGDIAEIIVWNNVLSAGNLTSLSTYTTNRYGIAA